MAGSSLTSEDPQEPNRSWCPPLKENLGAYKTPLGFYEWHESIWKYPVNPANFGPEIFHTGCLMIDPFATVKGPLRSSLYFQALFAAFPKLSGPHFSFAANDSSIFINWGFKTTGGRAEILVPVTDIFCLKGGLLNYRLSTFDIATLTRALLSAYGGTYPDLELHLEENLWRWHVDQDYANATLLKLKSAALK